MYLQAVLNPLQAVFNSIVYRSWETSSYIRLPQWMSRLLPTKPGTEENRENKNWVPGMSSTHVSRLRRGKGCHEI